MTDHHRRRLSTALATLDAARHHSQPELATRDATDALVAVVREIVGGPERAASKCGTDGYWCHGTCQRHGRCMYVAPERAAEGKPQAGDWKDGQRFFGVDDSAAISWSHGWDAWPPDAQVGRAIVLDGKEPEPIEQGPEVGPLGQTLADLCLCAHGFLEWERIEWASEAAICVAHNVLGPLGPTDRRVREFLTPETLPAVLAAVREVSRG